MRDLRYGLICVMWGACGIWQLHAGQSMSRVCMTVGCVWGAIAYVWGRRSAPLYAPMGELPGLARSGHLTLTGLPRVLQWVSWVLIAVGIGRWIL